MAPTADTKRLSLGLLIGVPISVGLGYLAFRGVDLADTRHSLTSAEPLALLSAVLLLCAMYVVQASRWRLIVGESRVTILGAGRIVVSGIAVNNALPGRFGDLMRARWLALDTRMPSGRALGTVVLDRSGDVVALVAFFVVSASGVDSAPWLRTVALGALVAILVVVGAIVVARAYTRRRPYERRERHRLRRLGRDTLDGIATPLGRRRAVVVMALSLASWSCFALAVVLVASAVGFHVGVLSALFVTAVVNLGVAIPSSPGFVGTYQWLAVESVTAVSDSTREEALAFSILLHAAWFVPTTVVGGLLIVRRYTTGRRRAAASGQGP